MVHGFGIFASGLAVVIPTPTSSMGDPFASQLCVSRRNYYSVFMFVFIVVRDIIYFDKMMWSYRVFINKNLASIYIFKVTFLRGIICNGYETTFAVFYRFFCIY